jgi:hypothetical protein
MSIKPQTVILMTVAAKPALRTSTVSLVQGDYLTIHQCRTWEQFKLIQKGFENASGMRLAYYKGTIEILMPGMPHEIFKKIIAVLVEAFLFDREIECRLIRFGDARKRWHRGFGAR